MRHRVLLRRSPYRSSRTPEQILSDGKKEAYRKANRKRLVEAAREAKARAKTARPAPEASAGSQALRAAILQYRDEFS